MKYGYAVKVNGVWYQPNTEIPEKDIAKNATTTTISEKETVKKANKK
jgi:hypothetical protein